VEVGLDPGSGNASALVLLTHPVQRLLLEQPQPESQVTVPWELERMARLPESQLGFSPTFNHRPACEEEEEEAPIVFSPLYQRNSNPKVASAAKSPVVLLAQRSHDSDESDNEDFYSVGSGGKTGESEKVDTGNKEDSDDDLLDRVHRLMEYCKSTDNVVDCGNEFISRVDVLLQGTKEKSSVTDVSATLSLLRCEKDAMQPRSDKVSKAKATRHGTKQKAPPTRTSPRAKKRTCVAVTAEELSFRSSHDGKPTEEGLEEEEVIEAIEESTEEVKEATEELPVETEEEWCCYFCGKMPCEWIEYGIPAIEDLKRHFNMDTAISEGYVVEMQFGNQFQNNKIRFTCYRLFTYEKFGHLGKGNRVKLPVCVEAKIKTLFPSVDGNYTKFKANPEYNSDQS
jgi:hypothetical protein